jgi:hypothetical protein
MFRKAIVTNQSIFFADTQPTFGKIKNHKVYSPSKGVPDQHTGVATGKAFESFVFVNAHNLFPVRSSVLTINILKANL